MLLSGGVSDVEIDKRLNTPPDMLKLKCTQDDHEDAAIDDANGDDDSCA